MRQAYHLETSREALAQAALDEQWGQAQHDDFQLPASAGVGVPQVLDGLRPAGDLLGFVEHEEGAVRSRLVGKAPRSLSLLLKPLDTAKVGWSALA